MGELPCLPPHLLFANGKNIKQIQTWPGHADPAFTLRTYLHMRFKRVVPDLLGQFVRHIGTLTPIGRLEEFSRTFIEGERDLQVDDMSPLVVGDEQPGEVATALPRAKRVNLYSLARDLALALSA